MVYTFTIDISITGDSYDFARKCVEDAFGILAFSIDHRGENRVATLQTNIIQSAQMDELFHKNGHGGHAS